MDNLKFNNSEFDHQRMVLQTESMFSDEDENQEQLRRRMDDENSGDDAWDDMKD